MTSGHTVRVDEVAGVSRMAATGEDRTGAVCRCGHPREAHRHYRKGTECSVCPAGECAGFRAAEPLWRRLFGKN